VTSGFWRAHGERAIYDSPWVWLGQVDVEPPGGDRYWHHVVRLRKAAVMALVDGEEPAVAATRELAEETGYRAGLLAAGEIWSAASVAALPLLLMKR
jgi:hypothetical protein